MALAIKSLVRIQLPTSETELYTPDSGKTCIIKSIRLVNTSGSAVTVDLFIKRGAGDSYRIIPKELTLPAGAAFIDDSDVILEGTPDDAIRGKAGTASVVDCVISGIERDV